MIWKLWQPQSLAQHESWHLTLYAFRGDLSREAFSRKGWWNGRSCFWDETQNQQITEFYFGSSAFLQSRCEIYSQQRKCICINFNAAPRRVAEFLVIRFFIHELKIEIERIKMDKFGCSNKVETAFSKLSWKVHSLLSISKQFLSFFRDNCCQ